MRWLVVAILLAGCAHRQPPPPTPYEQARSRADDCERARPGQCGEYWSAAEYERRAAEQHRAEKRARWGAALQGAADGAGGAARTQTSGTHCTSYTSGNTTTTDCN